MMEPGVVKVGIESRELIVAESEGLEVRIGSVRRKLLVVVGIGTGEDGAGRVVGGSCTDVGGVDGSGGTVDIADDAIGNGESVGCGAG